jgi:hypothetical protein
MRAHGLRQQEIDMNHASILSAALTALFLGHASASAQLSQAGPPASAPKTQRLRVPDAYAVDFVATAATGVAMNDFGDVVGTSYVDVGCGPFCLPPQETVVWRGGERIVLPSVPGLSGISVRDINNQGWVAGFAGAMWTATHAVVWKPVGGAYQAIDLGTLPGTNTSEAIGIDDQGRVIGWSTTTSWPPNGSPFLWTASGGMVDLSAQGFPDDKPEAISPGGTVATHYTWYRLGDPSSVTALAPPPAGYGIGGGTTAINDAGDQGRFLVTVGGENLSYLYRYHHEGAWQQLSPAGTGHLSTYGIGSINKNRDVTGTVQGTAVIAHGPDGLAQGLASLVSPAYPGSSVTGGGPLNASGKILARVMIGNSARLVRLTPAWACTGGCMRVEDLAVSADFIPDPTDPTKDHCSPALAAYNEAWAIVTVTDAAGFPLSGVVVSGRFLDDYWTDQPVVGTTGVGGIVSFPYAGHCGVGAIAFLVDGVTAPGLALDQTAGILSGWAIPQ